MSFKQLFKRFRFFFIGTLRRQLITSVALVHAVLMALFIWDLTLRQYQSLYELKTNQTQALTQNIATSAAGWVAARDLNGLQEIITTQSRYPEMLYAMILDKEGRVLAHTDTSYLGQFVKDLPETFETQILILNAQLVDGVSPIILADQPIGWVRVGLGQQYTQTQLHSTIREGVLYAIAAILIGSFLAWFMSTRLTRKLHTIELSARAVQNGDTQQRASLTGTDEISHVAQAFDSMLDTMVASRRELAQSEERFNLAMLASNDGLWDWNVESGDVYYSPRWKSMLGYEEDELANVFSTWENLVHPEDKPMAQNMVNDCLAGKSRGFSFETRLWHKQGHWVFILSRGMAIVNEAGSVYRMVGTHVDISEKKEKEEIIRRQADYDSLTLLPNRKLFQELLLQSMKQSTRDNKKLWMLFLDLDGFKEVNDTYGHHQGDELLIMVAKRIRTTIRRADIVARLGGDEFVVLLHNPPDTGYVDEVASKLIEIIGQAYTLDECQIYISTSIGITSYPDDADNVEELLKFADQSMYSAKSKGRNRYIYFTPALQEASVKRTQIITDLHQAIENNEFQMYYQPIVDLSNGSVHKAEALIRWQHPKRGIISPADFIPVAEDTGIIHSLGSWIFNSVLQQLQAWSTAYGSKIQITINMSPLQLKINEKKYDDILKRLKTFNLSGERIVIEITEGLLLETEAIVNKRLLDYRDAGVQVAIDDFGTGYSSLSYLKQFDIDYLKIDQSFTKNLRKGSSELALSETIVLMAHKMDLKVIAEGVETEQQLELLKSCGCDFGQGYLFSRPLAVEEFERTYIQSDNSSTE